MKVAQKNEIDPLDMHGALDRGVPEGLFKEVHVKYASSTRP